jgi:outer membrane immunogenic protein
MSNVIRRLSALLIFLSIAGAASAQSDNPWDGFYAGLNIGASSTHACNTWSSGATASPPDLSIQNCPKSGFAGGLQFGENFQRKHLVFGLGVDVDAWIDKSNNTSSSSAGTTGAPAATYTARGRLTPNDFFIIGPRVGYATDVFFPYVRGGGIVTSGAHEDGLSYTLAGSSKPLATLSGGKNFTPGGWVAGAGVEVGLHGPFSISAEYLHADLGKGSTNATSCTGSAAACAGLADIVSTHASFTANFYRIGFNYWFQYWNP